jgi:hypothetical protein
MGYLSYGYKASKTPIGKKVVETVKNIFTKKNKVSPDIKSVAPNVPVTKADKVKRDLRLAKQKSKTSQVKLDNTIFRIEQQKKRLEDMQKTKSQTQTRPGKQNLAKGGRIGLKRGTGLIKKKSNVEKIKKTFGPKKGLGMQSVIYGLDKNPKITAADPKAKFIAAANKKKKKKVI